MGGILLATHEEPGSTPPSSHTFSFVPATPALSGWGTIEKTSKNHWYVFSQVAPLLKALEDRHGLGFLRSPSFPAWYQTHARIGHIEYNPIPPTVRYLESPFPRNQGIGLNELFDRRPFRIGFREGKTPVDPQEPMVSRPYQQPAGLYNVEQHRPLVPFESEDHLEQVCRF